MPTWMSNLPAWALSHLDASLPAGNVVVNAQRIRRNTVLANTRLGAVLVQRGFWTGVSHVFLEVPAQKTAFRCASCQENLQFYNLELPSDVYCSICASKYHVDAEGKVTAEGGKALPAEFKAREVTPFPPVADVRDAVRERKGRGRKADPDGDGGGDGGDGEAFRHNGFTLYARRVETRGGARTLYFFSKGIPKSGEPSPLPDGYAVGSNGRTGLPYLRREGTPPAAGAEPAGDVAPARSGLTKKQVAQRKYAARMKGVRKRAGKAKGGKGRIANRRVATKLRRELGLKSP
jgi:hypothetical protein